MKFRPWSVADHTLLRLCYDELGAEACAQYLQRSAPAVRQQASILGITPKNLQLTKATYMSVLAEECAKWNVLTLDALSRSMKVEHLRPRFATWARLHKMGYSYPQIGKCAERNSSTVLMGVRRAEAIQEIRPVKRLIQPAGGIDKHLNTFSRSAQIAGE